MCWWSDDVKNTKQGFLVMEFLVYFFLFSCISYGVMHFIVNATLQLRKESKKLLATTELLTALDYISYSLQSAPSTLKLWKKKENNLLIWHDNDQNCDIGICLIKNKIWRIMGTYSLFKEAWTSKKKSLLANHIKEMSFIIKETTVANMPHISLITCSLTAQSTLDNHHEVVKKTILLENKVIA